MLLLILRRSKGLRQAAIAEMNANPRAVNQSNLLLACRKSLTKASQARIQRHSLPGSRTTGAHPLLMGAAAVVTTAAAVAVRTGIAAVVAVVRMMATVTDGETVTGTVAATAITAAGVPSRSDSIQQIQSHAFSRLSVSQWV